MHPSNTTACGTIYGSEDIVTALKAPRSGLYKTSGSFRIGPSGSVKVYIKTTSFQLWSATLSAGQTSNFSLQDIVLDEGEMLYFGVNSNGADYSDHTYLQGQITRQTPSGTPLLEANLITQNTATEGGGIGTYNGSPTIRNNLIISNTSTGPSGGALFISGDFSDVTITGNTIASNTSASSQGGGIFLQDGDAYISNCILWQNGGDLTNITATYSDVTDLSQSPGTGNISSDPLFVQTTNPDAPGYYRLSNTSPCNDSGDPSYQVEPDELDIDGKLRLVFRIDMGADELPDVKGPTISSVTFNTTPVADGMALHDSGAFRLLASDPSSVSRVEFSLDGTLIGTDTDGSDNYSCNWDIYQTEDGAHTLTITAYDSLGNPRSTSYTVTVALSPPATPTITSPTNGSTLRTIQITVAGQAGKNTTVQLYDNNTPAGSASTDVSGTFRVPVSLSEGVNTLQATATNRVGTSPLSTAVTVTLDTTIPKPPVNLSTLPKQGGVTTLTWNPPTGTSVKGYNIYRSSMIFASPQDATKINTGLITATSFDHLLPTDGVYYYGISTVDKTNQESILSNIASGVSDRTLPRASVTYQPTGQYTDDSLRIAQGLVNVTLTVTESLLSDPFLSMTPNGGVPIPVDLTKTSDTTYTGSFMISPSTPAGTVYAVFSARDLVGNRGTTIDSGASFVADTQGPSVTSISIQPQAPIKNDTPVSITMTIGLDEPVTSAPALAYLLSGQGRTQVPLTPTQLSSTSWQAIFTLPADAGVTVESLQLIYQGTDDLSNTSTRILCPNSFQVYQGELPPLTAPTNLKGISLPQGKIKLTWNAVPGAFGYQLYRQSPSQSSLFAYQALGTVLEYTDSPSSDGLYKYAVASIRSENGQQSFSPLSNTIEVVSDATPPGVPQNLSCVLTGSGIKATWEAPPFTEPITYSLYRSSLPAITSVEGMTPILTSTATTATDPRPSHTDHSYVVTAKDASGNESAPSNSFYLNFDLLPVSSIKIVLTDTPVISWTHPGGDIAGYNIYLGTEKLNASLLTALSYTDTGYAGDERRYTVTAVDRTNRESVGRSITLPRLTTSLNTNEKIRRGIINSLGYVVTSASTAKIDNIIIKNQVTTRTHRSETFSIDPASSKTVSVPVGGYSDLPDLVTLTTTTEIAPEEGSLIQIVKSTQIESVQDTLSLQLSSEEFTRGGTGKVWFTLENTGEEEIEIVTAKGSSSSDEIVFSLRDTDGNVITTMPYKQNTGNVITLANGTTVARIPVSESFTSTPVQLPVPLTAPASLAVRLDISKVYFHYGQGDQVSITGLSATTPVSLKETPYYGEIVSITPQTSTGNEDIIITGRAINRQTSQPAPFVPLKLIITLSGFERSSTVLTGIDGTFAYTFKPPTGESGIYKVRVVHPDVTDKPVMGQFTISKVSITPSVINLTIPKNYEKAISLSVATSEGTDVHNLKITAPEIEGVHTALGSPIHLGSKGTATLPFTIWADNKAPSAATITLMVSSDEAVWGTVTINAQFQEARPALYYTPDHVETGVALNQMVTETITLENKGLADLTDMTLSIIPQSGGATPSWVVLSGTQGSLPVGGKRVVSLTFSPTGIAEGVYPFYLRVTSSNYPTTDIRIYVSVTQSGIGNALFKVQDIYSGTLQNNRIVQGLSNAKITIQNEQVLTIQQIKNTDSLGEALFTGLPTGTYKYRVSAANHQEQIGRLWIKPGVTQAEQVFLDYNLVTVEWEVKETTIKDTYEVVLTATYETNVPAAVVAIEPKSIIIPAMKAGEVFYGELTITNYGLIRADNVRLTSPSTDQYFKYEFLKSVPQTLAAKEKITIPYRITALTSGDGSGGGCYTYAPATRIDYTYTCANGQLTARADLSYFVKVIGVCISPTGTTSPVTINISGGGAPGGGSSGGGWGGQSSPISGIVCPPERTNPIDCQGTCPPPNRQPVQSDVDVLRGEYIDIVTDLFVKVPGHKIEAKRRYYDDAWHFDNDYLKLELAYANDGSISSIIKDGVRYTKQDAALFVFKDYRIYVQNGFRFEDKYGNWALYDTTGRMTSYGNPNNVKVSLLYTDNKLTGMADNSGTQIIWYDYTNGLLTSVRDATRRVDYVYTNNKLTKVIDPLLQETIYTYDTQGRLSTKKDPANRTYTITYNSYGFVKSVLNPEGKGKSFDYSYDAARQERYAQIKYPSGKIIEEWYDRFGEQIRKDLNGRTIKTTLINGRYKTITDASGNKTYKEYDDRNNLLKQTNPDNTIQTYEYESRFNQVTREVNERGIVTTYQYDTKGNLLRKTEALNTPTQRITDYTYDPSTGYLLTTTRVADANTAAAATTFAYDPMGNVKTITDPESNITTFTYNTLGDVLTKKDGRDKTWTFTYDNLGRLKTATDPLTNKVIYEYDGVGNKTKEIEVYSKVVDRQ
jgi:YD repeat-containing protein